MHRGTVSPVMVSALAATCMKTFAQLFSIKARYLTARVHSKSCRESMQLAVRCVCHAVAATVNDHADTILTGTKGLFG